MAQDPLAEAEIANLSPASGVDPYLPPPGMVRRVAARGVVINSAFQVGLGTLNLLKAMIGAAYLSASDYGIWSILLLAIAMIALLKAVTVSGKYIQQDEEDQEEAFQKAFTLELISTAIMLGVALVAAPLLGLVYGRDELVAPTLVFALLLPGLALQAPIWVFHRRMDFLRQRLFLAVDPVVSFVITVALLVAGFDYWALIVGQVSGSWLGGVVASIASPYKLRLRYDRGTTREYLSFSWPLVIAVLGGLGIAQISVFVGEVAIGLAAAGAIGFASQISAYTDKIDLVITQAMYPAICRARDRSELLFEAFVKSNRIALMWGVPFGVGLALFGADLVHFVIGDHFEHAIVLIQVFGLCAAVNHIGFNWTAFYQALGNNRPLAVVTLVTLISFLCVCVPLTFAAGLDGFAAGLGVMTVTALGMRYRYLIRLFPEMRIFHYALRAIAPTIPAVLTVAAMRTLEGADRGAEVAVLELVLYLFVTAAATWLFERPLLREALSYVRPRAAAPAI